MATLDAEYYIDGTIKLGENAIPQELGGALLISQAKRLDGTWPLSGGAMIRLNGIWVLNGEKLLTGGGTRLEIARRHEKL